MAREKTEAELETEADALVAGLQKKIAKVRAEFWEKGITMPDEMIALMLERRATSMKLKDLVPRFGSGKGAR